jgi:4-aminobutyrate aminotransferase/diaminobutyrate-pyruvate transaminase/4-aminobutyrate aminotransferase/(S)-3-amino-2-methylpropionate transaminase
METYQGGTAAFAPRSYVQSLRQWCSGHKALLVLDEVQAGFGRTGTLWGFEHYGVVPDLATFGKGLSSSLPIAAVAGRAEVMDLFPPGTMSSTHTGNPVCCAAALASIDLIVNEKLAERARVNGALLHHKLSAMQTRFPQIGFVAGKGLVAGVICVRPGTKTPDGDLAFDIVRRTVEKGVLMFGPVGHLGSTVKICPPLVIPPEAIEESVAAFEEAVAEAVAARQAGVS